MFQSVNPYDSTILAEYSQHTPNETEIMLSQAEEGFKKLRQYTIAERAEWVRAAARVLREGKERYGQLMTREMGKPILQAKAEVEKCAWVCEYFADNAERFLEDELIQTDASKSYISYCPLGVILAIMPWNFPFWQVFRFAAPTLLAGNAIILKHAPNVFGNAEAIEAIWKEAGLPEHVFQSIRVQIPAVENIIRDRRVQAVTLTGSTRAGKSVAAIAGSALKKTVLELGGSDPYIILKDADLKLTLEACLVARLLNTGQSCIAGKRFIIVKEVYDEFEEMFVEAMRSRTMGNPLDPAMDLGPLARMDLRDTLAHQVWESIKMGAEPVLGCNLPDSTGAFYPASVIRGIKKGMPAYHEELFGPVAVLFKVDNEDEAFSLAADTSYGLGGAVFTKDSARGELLAKEQINAGSCFVNAFVKSDPRLPFGGIQESGYGRELGLQGIREFVNIKTVYVK